jgi:hypothetical protein
MIQQDLFAGRFIGKSNPENILSRETTRVSDFFRNTQSSPLIIPPVSGF